MSFPPCRGSRERERRTASGRWIQQPDASCREFNLSMSGLRRKANCRDLCVGAAVQKSRPFPVTGRAGMRFNAAV